MEFSFVRKLNFANLWDLGFRSVEKPQTSQNTGSHSAPDQGGPVACLGGPVACIRGSLLLRWCLGFKDSWFLVPTILGFFVEDC